ncbi:uncharacterized protein LOC132278627 isoform X2 [Cornus florida]|uniref:uncharacterized protein LOC132278627 isoform X2 n=1 Tax=Cornus florida TaxID=4283 RepID=UPI00289C15D4|nr:uncharacterized protein LOC132278627 isoform X2 [Cornus florida]
MSPESLRLISSSSSTMTAVFPPKPPISPPLRSKQQFHQISRRDAAVLSIITVVVPLLHQPSPAAAAFSIGISGPKDWLKEQKKKAYKVLLAPIDASRNTLRTVYLLLTNSDSDFVDKEMEQVQTLLKSAARDCVPEDRNSFVAFQASTGVEVCTFRLVVKNASSLLDDKDPIKLEAEANLTDLIRSFSSLNGMANEVDIQLPSNRFRRGFQRYFYP